MFDYPAKYNIESYCLLHGPPVRAAPPHWPHNKPTPHPPRVQTWTIKEAPRALSREEKKQQLTVQLARMGVKSLTSFVKKHSRGLFKQVELKEWKAIVVDGNGLCHYLYLEKGCDWQQGGEYPQFFSEAKSYFQRIRDAGVEPVVLFDGSHDQSKTRTVLKRKEEKNRDMLGSQSTGIQCRAVVSPILMLQTFIDVLVEMKIEFHVAPKEGDKEVAGVANSRGCPVLSSDSDFYMYDLTHGFIPLEYFSTTSQCSLYHIDNLVSYFGLRDSKLRLFIPALHGNDFISPLSQGYPDFMVTLRIASRYANSEDCLLREYCSSRRKSFSRGQAVVKNYKMAEEQYCNVSLQNYETQKREYISLYSLPEWTFDSFLKGSFHPHLLDTLQHKSCILGNVVEDISQECAWVCSRNIRRNVYGFIGVVGNVSENIRHDHLPNMVEHLVDLSNLALPVTLRDYKDKDGESFVLSVLGCTEPARSLKAFFEQEQKWKLPLATFRYWYQNSKFVTKDLLSSLLLCFLHCSGVLVCSEVAETGQRDMLALHVFAQWQCVYYDALVLNNVAKTPFISTSPSEIYSGRVAMFFASKTIKAKNSVLTSLMDFVCYDTVQ